VAATRWATTFAMDETNISVALEVTTAIIWDLWNVKLLSQPGSRYNLLTMKV